MKNLDGYHKGMLDKELKADEMERQSLVPMLSHNTVLEWEKVANYLFFVFFGIWIFIHKEKLTSGIPEPQA